MSENGMDAVYRTLANRAWETNRGRAAELAELVAEWDRTGALAAERREHGRALAHSLRGSAGTFGHDAAADAADELERLLVAGEVSVEVVGELVARIEADLSRAPELML
ncbi:MAG TPA: Hpt domain-containing protein [Micropruina sp.]|nr:Hpt domain-containing protein [Micropruina sp.]